MNIKKFLYTTTTVVLAVVALASPASAASTTSSHSFTDVGDRYAKAVDFLYAVELINGKSPTKFGTNDPLTRGDAAVILANTLFSTIENPKDAGFKDLNTRVRASVNALAEVGIVSGVTPTEFQPGAPLSRGAMAKFLSLAFELEEYQQQTPFSDVGGVFKPYIESLYGAQITAGKTPSTYGTHTQITRGEFANLLYKTIETTTDWLYYPEVADVKVTTVTSTTVTLTEPALADYTATEIADFLEFMVILEDGTEVPVEPTSFKLSADRLVLTIGHTKQNLTGKAGHFVVSDFDISFESPFNFKLK
ncbi:hypothetical protein AUO94_09010 [Planococcus kocurii]|uniref:SLH domain-containing protein n=1 Tax=Planococcus kocurii TaxID=1374 RepID=A0ABM5WWR7_9BACL|nr:S-layer homology domain-containing protein [Planococcus kocurii]ALS78785.1 hypothetical protein AUO94_09010 [Planococcus kocurii]